MWAILLRSAWRNVSFGARAESSMQRCYDEHRPSMIGFGVLALAMAVLVAVLGFAISKPELLIATLILAGLGLREITGERRRFPDGYGLARQGILEAKLCTNTVHTASAAS